MDAEMVSSTSPLRQMMRSLRSREKMSEVCQEPLVWSVTKGMGMANLVLGDCCCCWEDDELSVGGKGGMVKERRGCCWRRTLRWRRICARVARRVQRVMCSIVEMCRVEVEAELGT